MKTHGGFLGWLDNLAHHPRMGWLPRWATGWLCDRLDLALGVTKDELRRVRDERTPWPQALGGSYAFPALSVSGSTGTYACTHMATTIAGVSCGQCGPLQKVR